MSAEAIDTYIPTVRTLDGLAAMNEADTHGYRYELSPEGVLSVMPPPDLEHALIASRIMLWLAAAGWAADQMAQAAGVRVGGRAGGEGGRIPDLVVWSRPPPPNATVWLPNTDVVLIVEIVSASSWATDKKVKRDEYAGAGFPRYWTVDRDPGQTVTMHELIGDAYAVHESRPLSWVLNADPRAYLG